MLYAVSRIPTNNTPLSVYSTHTLYQTKHPSHLEHNLEAGSPLAGLHKNPTPGQHPAVGHTRTHPYRIYRAPVRLWRGCSQSRAFVFVSLSLSVSCHSLVTRFCLGVTRFCLVGDNASSVVRRNNERARASASLVSSLVSLVVCVLSLISSEREGARSLVLFGCMSSNYGVPTKDILVSRSAD